MKFISKNTTKNNSHITNMKGDIYEEQSFKSALMQDGIFSISNDYSLSRNNQKETIVKKITKNLTTHIIQRSNIMKSSIFNTLAGRGFYLLLIAMLVTATTFGQLIISTNGTPVFKGIGTYTIKTNIIDSNAAAATIHGIVTMGSTTAKDTIGTAGKAAINFDSLIISNNSTYPTALMVSTEVGENFNVAASSVLNMIGTTTLTIDSLSSVGAAGSLGTTTNSTVVYDDNNAQNQTIIGLAYSGPVTLSGASTKDINSFAAASVAGAFSHSGGALNVDQNLTVSSATPSFATISNVATGMTLTLSATGAKTIAAVTTTTGTGAISNTGTNGLLTITALNGNNGSINGGAGGVTFTNAATNAGNIGGAGAITFSNTLNHGTGTITAGAGGITFGNTVTFSSGTITAGTGTALTFNGNVANSGTAALTLTGTGTASFAGSLNATGLNFASGSTVTYNSSTAGQGIADVAYGNLALTSGTKSWALGAARTISSNLSLDASSVTNVTGAFALNVGGNVSLSSNLTVANAVVFANAGSTVSGTNEIVGSVTRTISATGAYTLNNASTSINVTTLGSLSSFTMLSQPLTNPTIGYVSGHTINRNYVPTYTGASFNATLQLAYLSSEIVGATESRLRDFQTALVKADTLKGGAYTRSAAGGGFGYTSLPSIAAANLTSGVGLALDDRFWSFISVAIGPWSTAGTWSANSIPTSNDDIEIASAYAVTIPTATTALANSVLIDNGASGGLTLAASSSAVLNVQAGGIINNNSTGAGLTLGSGSSVTVAGGPLTNSGTITNNGSITVQ